MEGDDRIGVIHLISGLEMGGAERMLLWTARHHNRETFEIMVVSLMSGGHLAPLIRAEGVEVVELGQKKGRLSFRTMSRLLRLTRSFSPVIIQGHLFHSNLISRFLALLVPGALSVSTRHNEIDSPFRKLLYKITSPFSSGTVVFSEPVQRHSMNDSSSGGPVHLAPYGIDPQQPYKDRDIVRSDLGLSSGTFLWIAVGRLTKQKGFDILLEAFSALLDTIDTSSLLLLVGEGEEREFLEKKGSEMVKEGCVKFLGQRDDIPNLLTASDAFVLSSRWEGGPLVVLEAMAAGLPVVATRVGGTPDMVVEGETGTLVPPGEISDLAEAMGKVMEDGQRARRWGLKGQERMLANFSYQRTQRSMEQFYTTLTMSVEKR